MGIVTFMEKYMILFKEKISNDYWEYIKEILKMEKSEIIIKANDIATMNWLRSELHSFYHFPDQYIQYLSQFDHPLKMVFDAWNSNEHNMSEALEGLLWDMTDKEAYEDGYVKIDIIEDEEESLE